jgi:hypothetical protein
LIGGEKEDMDVIVEDEDEQEFCEEESEDGEEEFSSTAEGCDLRGTYLPGCCQKMSCGSCNTTQKLASSKTNSSLSKNALRLDMLDSDVSVMPVCSD